MLRGGIAEKVELLALVEFGGVLADELGLEDCLAGCVRVESEQRIFSSSADRISCDCNSPSRSSAWRQDWRSNSLTEGELRLSLKG
jgi:hypothetical protein